MGPFCLKSIDWPKLADVGDSGYDEIMLGGPSKTFIALLPAIIAFIVAIVKKDFTQSDGALWFWIIIAILALGGIITAKYIVSSLLGHAGVFVKGLVSLIIIVAYVVTFFFTGCLVAGNLGLFD